MTPKDHTQEPIQKCCEKCACKNMTKDHQFVRGDHSCDNAKCECHQPPIQKCGNCHQDHHGETMCYGGKFLEPFPVHKVSDVVREFEEEFLVSFPMSVEKGGGTHSQHLEAWITQTLTTLLSSIVEQIEGGMKKPTEDQEHGLEYDQGYDDAKEDDITIIKSAME